MRTCEAWTCPAHGERGAGRQRVRQGPNKPEGVARPCRPAAGPAPRVRVQWMLCRATEASPEPEAARGCGRARGGDLCTAPRGQLQAGGRRAGLCNELTGTCSHSPGRGPLGVMGAGSATSSQPQAGALSPSQEVTWQSCPGSLGCRARGLSTSHLAPTVTAHSRTVLPSHSLHPRTLRRLPGGGVRGGRLGPG